LTELLDGRFGAFGGVGSGSKPATSHSLSASPAPTVWRQMARSRRAAASSSSTAPTRHPSRPDDRGGARKLIFLMLEGGKLVKIFKFQKKNQWKFDIHRGCQAPPSPSWLRPCLSACGLVERVSNEPREPGGWPEGSRPAAIWVAAQPCRAERLRASGRERPSRRAEQAATSG
jgi:hypothetical protein